MSETIRRVAMLGHGRFGRSLAELLEEAGLEVRAVDPSGSVPDARRCESLEALVESADAVVLAVPVDALRGSLDSIRARLRSDQLVLDVASVKQRPVETLTAVLGREIPWVATHPLFGPSSVAAGERPLRVVVCPNPLHPDAAARARALYERLGCVVAEHDAETHDRLMARTHALAFFLAKGMLDVGLRADLPFAPPSFRAMARTLEAVQSDAGHLFVTIERDNPHAATTRRELLDALERIDAALGRPTPSDPADPPRSAEPHDPTTIPDLDGDPADRRDVDELVAACDLELARTLARRTRLVDRLRRRRTDAETHPDLGRVRAALRVDSGLSDDDLDAALELLARLGGSPD